MIGSSPVVRAAGVVIGLRDGLDEGFAWLNLGFLTVEESTNKFPTVRMVTNGLARKSRVYQLGLRKAPSVWKGDEVSILA